MLRRVQLHGLGTSVSEARDPILLLRGPHALRHRQLQRRLSEGEYGLYSSMYLNSRTGVRPMIEISNFFNKRVLSLSLYMIGRVRCTIVRTDNNVVIN